MLNTPHVIIKHFPKYITNENGVYVPNSVPFCSDCGSLLFKKDQKYCHECGALLHGEIEIDTTIYK